MKFILSLALLFGAGSFVTGQEPERPERWILAATTDSGNRI